MFRHRCPECELTLPLSSFSPRDNSVYELPEAPSLAEVERQSRCRDCNRLYLRRRRFVKGELARRARVLKLELRPLDKSSYRKIELRSMSFPGRGLRTLYESIDRFNEQLPCRYSEVRRHGITLVTEEQRCGGSGRQELLLFEDEAQRAAILEELTAEAQELSFGY